MSIFSVVSRRSSAHLKEVFTQKSALVNLVGFSWGCSSGRDHQAFYFYPRQSAAGTGQRRKMGAFLASLIARFIVRQFGDVLLEDLLQRYYFYFRPNERREIFALARQKIQKGSVCYRPEATQAIIESRLKHFFLLEGVHLNLDGFVNFRLQDYRDELKKVLAGAVENFLAEKEYRELIQMLRYFLDTEEPKIDLIHLSLDQQGQFQVTDQRCQQVDLEEWEELTLEELEEGDYEDLLVSMLVTIAPRHILVHQNVTPRYPRAVETLRRIFEQRLSFCGGCPHCQATTSCTTRDGNPV